MTKTSPNETQGELPSRVETQGRNTKICGIEHISSKNEQSLTFANVTVRHNCHLVIVGIYIIFFTKGSICIIFQFQLRPFHSILFLCVYIFLQSYSFQCQIVSVLKFMEINNQILKLNFPVSFCQVPVA